jgi:UPF0716 family protein affecting phage T7 exclusion
VVCKFKKLKDLMKKQCMALGLGLLCLVSCSKDATTPAMNDNGMQQDQNGMMQDQNNMQQNAQKNMQQQNMQQRQNQNGMQQQMQNNQ